MSLILDALRKLEREKDARAPGVLVVGSVPWGERSRTSRLLLLAGVAALLLLAVGVGWMLRPVRQAPAAAAPAPEAPATPLARPAPTPLPQSASGPATATATSALQAPPPIRLSRPPSSDAAGATATPSTASVATQGVPEPAPAAASEPAPAATDAAPGGLRLTAISQRDGRPVALINDRLVFEGDSFDGVRVLRIGEAEVEVEVRGERRTLRF